MAYFCCITVSECRFSRLLTKMEYFGGSKDPSKKLASKENSSHTFYI